MSERTITKAQFDELMVPILSLAGIHGRFDRVSPANFHVPLTRETTVEVKFHGPVGVDEYDALLAHVAFYKLLVPKKTEQKIGEEDAVRTLKELVAKIWERP